jgi:hypothetical protein
LVYNTKIVSLEIKFFDKVLITTKKTASRRTLHLQLQLVVHPLFIVCESKFGRFEIFLKSYIFLIDFYCSYFLLNFRTKMKNQKSSNQIYNQIKLQSKLPPIGSKHYRHLLEMILFECNIHKKKS